MPRRTDLKHVLVIGSGPIIIGQACEFDYSGTQACRVLRAEGLKVSLVNSNPATIMAGSVGVVVGATVTDPPDVSGLGGPVLVPGVGAQGGKPEDLGGFAGSRPGQLLPAVSREILRAGPGVTALREAAEKYRDAVAYLV